VLFFPAGEVLLLRPRVFCFFRYRFFFAAAFGFESIDGFVDLLSPYYTAPSRAAAGFFFFFLGGFFSVTFSSLRKIFFFDFKGCFGFFLFFSFAT